MSETRGTIIAIFNKWIEGPVSRYHLADHDIYQTADTNALKRSPLNPFIQNAADIRVKFGGFLERELLDAGGDLTVHSELKVTHDDEYYCHVDLSIHEVPNTASLAAHDEGISAETMCAVMQVRFIDYLASKENTYNCTDFHTDFVCLLEFPKKVERFLLIIDEGTSMGSDVIEDLRRMARECEVALLSNNEWISSENF